jgi:hypothetical protein
MIGDPSRGIPDLLLAIAAESFAVTKDSALIWLQGESCKLAHQPQEPGPLKVVWSDGEHSLTWTPAVRLMWMNGSTHLMCGRGGHKH